MDTRSRIVPTENEALSQAPLALHSVDAFRALDQTKEAAIARLTGGLSPAALSLAVADWLIHLSSAPGKRLQLAALAVANARRIGDYMLRSALGGSRAGAHRTRARRPPVPCRCLADGALSPVAPDIPAYRTMVAGGHARCAGHDETS